MSTLDRFHWTIDTDSHISNLACLFWTKMWVIIQSVKLQTGFTGPLIHICRLVIYYLQIWKDYVEETKETEEIVDDKTEREVDYKKVIVTEVDEDLRFYAQFVDNGMLSFKSFFFVYGQTLFNKKSLKIPKGLSESVYRRTDNTIAKRKSTKEQTTINKTYI